MTKEDFLRRMRDETYTGYPGQHADALEEWVTSLSDEERRDLARVLSDMLISREELSAVLWFLSWVVPFPELIPELEGLAAFMDEMAGREPLLVDHVSLLVGYVHIVSDLRIETVLPYLHKWANMALGPTHLHTYFAAVTAFNLMSFSKEDGLRYVAAIAKGDVRAGVTVPLSATAYLMTSYLRAHPDDAVTLGRAYAGLKGAYARFVQEAVEHAAVNHVRTGYKDAKWQERTLQAFRCAAGF